MNGQQIEAALVYARQRYAIFPCDPISKKPYIKGWPQAATTDEQQIREWWGQRPNALIGLPTGKLNGFWVLDVDVKNGKNGWDSLKQLFNNMQSPPTNEERAALSSTWTQQTPSGGFHLVFKYPENLPPKGKIRTTAGKLQGQDSPGLDVRGDGGYIIGAPSIMADGKSYQAIKGPESLAVAPDWLLGLVIKSSPQKKETPQSVADGELQRNTLSEREQWYVNKILTAEFEKVKSAPEGERNDTLNRSSYALFQLVAGGYLNDEAVRDELFKAAVEREGGLTAEEAERTIASAREAGLASPRTISLPGVPPGFDLREDGIYCLSSRGGKDEQRW